MIAEVGSLVVQLLLRTNSSIDISRSRFEDNLAEWGGAIFAEQDSIINMSTMYLIVTRPNGVEEYCILTTILSNKSK